MNNKRLDQVDSNAKYVQPQTCTKAIKGQTYTPGRQYLELNRLFMLFN